MVRPLKVGGTIIANRVVFAVLAFVFLYFMSVVGLIFLQLVSGLDFMTALSAILACINNAGPGLRSGRPGKQLRDLERFSDLGVLGGHAPGKAGGFYHSGAVHTHFVEKMNCPRALRYHIHTIYPLRGFCTHSFQDASQRWEIKTQEWIFLTLSGDTRGGRRQWPERLSGSSSSGTWPRLASSNCCKSGFSRSIRANVAALKMSERAPRMASAGTWRSARQSGHRSDGAAGVARNASPISGSASARTTPAGVFAITASRERLPAVRREIRQCGAEDGLGLCHGFVPGARGRKSAGILFDALETHRVYFGPDVVQNESGDTAGMARAQHHGEHAAERSPDDGEARRINRRQQRENVLEVYRRPDNSAALDRVPRSRDRANRAR